MARADKAAAVAELAEAFRGSSAAVLTEYRGLTVAQLKELRTALAGNATYAVVKNTLSKIAAREAGVEGLETLLEGPSAIAFVTGDPVEVAKGLRDFARNNPPLVVKGGVLDGKPLTAEEVRRLADLESREVLLAKLAGGMKASLQQAVSMFAAPLSQFARLAGALQAKAEAEPSVLAGGAGTPASDAAPAATDEAPVSAAAAEAAATETAAAESAATETAPTTDTAAAESAPAESAAAETAPPESASTESAADTPDTPAAEDEAVRPADTAEAVEAAPDAGPAGDLATEVVDTAPDDAPAPEPGPESDSNQ